MAGSQSNAQTPLLQAIGIKKNYGHVEALRGADFDVRRGEIVALIGDNGAGKSTLAKVLAGVIQPDGGEVRMQIGDDTSAPVPVAFNSPTNARAHGIDTVYQDLALCNDLDPTANLFLGREVLRKGLLGRLGFLDSGRMRREAGRLVRVARNRRHRQPPPSLRFLGRPAPRGGGRPCGHMGRAHRHHGRAHRRARRPPDRQRSPPDASVRDVGLSVILISHNMTDVLEVADRIQVMRLGRTVAEFSRSEATIEGLVAAMTYGVAQGEPP